MAPDLSVVLPVLGEARFLAGTLDRLLDQSLEAARYEVLVVDGGSSDGTVEIARDYAARDPRVRLLANPARRSSAGRNVGWKAARGRYVLFIDGHVFLEGRDLLRISLEAFERGHAVLARPQPLDPPGLSAFQNTVAAARATWLGHQGGSEIFRATEGEVDPSSSGAGYTRALLEELGGYDERFDACEDVEFNERVKERGLMAWCSPGFTVRYYPREDLHGLWRQVERYGLGRARLWRKHPRTLGPTVPLPALFFLFLVACAILGAWSPWLARGGAAAFALYALAVITASIQAQRGARGPISPSRLPAVFVVIHLGFAVGFVREVCRPRATFS